MSLKTQFGFTNKYSIAIETDEKGQQYFIHYACNRRSYNKNDIKFLYCGVCHTFPKDEEYRDTIKKATKIAEKNSVKKGFY